MQGVGHFTTEELIRGNAQHPWITEEGALHNADPNKYKLPL
jgi:xanthine dehydrogenase/oxidase